MLNADACKYLVFAKYEMGNMQILTAARRSITLYVCESAPLDLFMLPAIFVDNDYNYLCMQMNKNGEKD